MCSDSAAVVASDLALQKAQTAMTTTLNSNYATDFAEQQGVLAQQQARLNAMAANPLGYTPQQLATATSAIDTNTANAAKSAIGAASAYAATHGAADVGSGPTGQLAGAVASSAAQSKAAQLASLSEQNQSMKQQNYWNAIQGLNSVGAQYGGSGATAIGGANNAADSAINAGSAVVSADNEGWQDLGSLLGGIGSLVTGGAGVVSASKKN